MKKNAPHLPGIFDIAATVKNNHLYYGDNLTVMQSMPNACVDLIYLDPPFNSQRNYNLIYKKLTGLPVPEQEEAFCDAWDLDPEKEKFVRNLKEVLKNEVYEVDPDVFSFWQAWMTALSHTQPRLLAYLVYMSHRLCEMKRILKPAGSIYLHCDSTASHYIKVIMDGIFGHQNFRNEIIWKRQSAHSDAKRRFADVTDTILFYSRSNLTQFKPIYGEHDPDYISKFYRFDDHDGRGPYRLGDMASPNPRPNMMYEWMGFSYPAKGWRYQRSTMQKLHDEARIYYPRNQDGSLDTSKRLALKRYLNEQEGSIITNVWTDINPLHSTNTETLGYPTQKPIALLERIIQVSSNPGDVVFDPFCGCGSAIYAAHQLGRKWMGCDIAILSVQIVRDVLEKRYGLIEDEHYEISGIPLSIEGAADLFKRDTRQFQHWSVEIAGGFSSTKHSGDQGIDGRIHFQTEDGLKNMVLSVKGGHITPAYVRELRGVLERERDSEMAGFICLQEPTKGMRDEAAAAGLYTYLGTDYHRLQIRTIQDLLDGRGFDTPSKVQTLNWVKQIPLPL
jgi:site-specific DNA-methyltransferase (adenine-specific)